MIGNAGNVNGTRRLSAKDSTIAIVMLKYRIVNYGDMGKLKKPTHNIVTKFGYARI